MRTTTLLFSIIVIILLVFTSCVIYTQSQWQLIGPGVNKLSSEPNNSSGAAQVAFIVLLSKNETSRCNNSFDDDNDTFTDCLDSDCYLDKRCQNEEA